MYRALRNVIHDHAYLLTAAAVADGLLWVMVLRSRPMDFLSNGVAVWWAGLCGVSVLNLCGWHVSAAAVARRKPFLSSGEYRFQRYQLFLAAAYVLGCGYRAILPRADVQRMTLLDSWVTSVLVGRSVATVAELCFVVQCALLLHVVARSVGSRFGVAVAWLIVPLIAVAEVCSWFAVLTTSYLGHAIEESLWAVSAALLVVSSLAVWSRCRAGWRPFLAAGIVMGTGYVAFMCAVDVPMYVSRWLADEAQGRAYLSLGQGFTDVWARRCVTFGWEDWHAEIPWMTLYFSVAVWWSIALVHAPWFTPRRDSPLPESTVDLAREAPQSLPITQSVPAQGLEPIE
jgi:hypothetical protein